MSDTAAVNQAYFNKIAADYDNRFKATLGQLEEEVRNHSKDFIGVKQDGRLLDYACGTGLLSRALGDRLSQCIGIDVSNSMVEAYNAKAKSEGPTSEQKVAYEGNLILPSDPSPSAFADESFFNFDIAGVGAGFHHFEDCDLAARRLGERLRQGGVFFILDFMPHGVDAATTSTPLDQRGVMHHGFSEERMRSTFEGAGVGKNFAFKELENEIVFHHAHGDGKDMRRKIFFARGEKA